MATSYVPLRLRSRYSLLTGTIPATEVGGHLARLGFGAGAMLDSGNVYGAVDFYVGMAAEGVKPILGAEVDCPVTGERLGLIALDRDGYGRVCRVVTEKNPVTVCEFSARPRERNLIDLLAASEGTGGGRIAVLARTPEYASRVAEVVGKENVWVEVILNRERPGEARARVGEARRRGLKVVANWEVLGETAADQALCLTLQAMQKGYLVSQARLGAREPWLEKLPYIEREARGLEEALRETARIAEMVDMDLGLGVSRFPRATPSPTESLARLRAMCEEALPRRYRGAESAARKRLEKELRTIGKLGFSDYFLVVADIVGYARKEGIPVCGRGSGASSIVSYLLGITHVDPISQGLLFERFLNEHRPDYPDLDVDLSWKRRDEVIRYVYERFGHEYVAMISTHNTFEVRSAAREVAKAFGLSPYEAQALSSLLPHSYYKDHDGVDAKVAKYLKNVKPEMPRDVAEALGKTVSRVVGYPHHSSVHCGGVVISDKPITYYTALELAPKGIAITQADMYAIEKLGLVKIDLLGNRALAVVEDTVRAAHLPAADPTDIAPDDAETAALLAAGDTLSCFNLESPAMRSLLTMLKARDRDDAILALALVRPGPSAGGMKEKYIRLRAQDNGNGVRGRTNGIPLYQEDVMKLMAMYTGMTYSEADILRRELGDRKLPREELRERFMFLAESAGTSRRVAENAWEKIARFAAYSFCKAHAASYGALSYTTAYLRAHYPLEYFMAVLRHHAGMYPTWVHVNQARRAGVMLLLPDINRSEVDFTVDGEAVRTGFGSVRDLALGTMKRIVTERKERRFRSLQDFLVRVSARKEEVESLIACGAFDEVEPERCQALARYFATRGRATVVEEPVLGFEVEENLFPVANATQLRRRRMEYDILGFSPLAHPLEFFDTSVQESLEPEEGARAPRSGRASRTGVLAAKRYHKGNGEPIYFLTLDHPDGLTECVAPARAVKVRLKYGQAYTALGRLQNRYGVTTLKVNSLMSLPESDF
jgi:DNA-directed DNA polymerase III PolC